MTCKRKHPSKEQLIREELQMKMSLLLIGQPKRRLTLRLSTWTPS